MTKKWTTSNQELIFEAMTCYMHTFISLTISFKRYICFLDVHLLKDMLLTMQHVVFVMVCLGYLLSQMLCYMTIPTLIIPQVTNELYLGE